MFGTYKTVKVQIRQSVPSTYKTVRYIQDSQVHTRQSGTNKTARSEMKWSWDSPVVLGFAVAHEDDLVRYI